MVTDQLLYGGVCLVAGLVGLVRPGIALVLYRVTRGRSPNPDVHPSGWVRAVAGFLVVVVGVAAVVTGW